MSASPPLTRDIGRAERTLRALLERELERHGLSFEQWTTLVLLHGAGSLPAAELLRRQQAGRVGEAGAVAAALDALRAAGLVAAHEEPTGAGGGDEPLTVTEAGRALLEPLLGVVSGLTAAVHRDLTPADIAVTRETLARIADRADALLGTAAG